MDQVWKGLSNLDPRDPGGFYKKTALKTPNKRAYCTGHTSVYQLSYAMIVMPGQIEILSWG